jgi:hypothetical protein
MDTIDLLKEYWPSVAYGVAILFGGAYGTRVLPDKIFGTVLRGFTKFTLFSAFIGIIFILLEKYAEKSFKNEEATKYLVAFLIVNILYVQIMKKIFQKWGIVEKDPETPKP